MTALAAGIEPGRLDESVGRSLDLAAAAAEQGGGLWLAECSLVADVLALAVARRNVSRAEVHDVVHAVTGDGSASAGHLVFTLAVRSPGILALGPETAIQAQLRLLYLLAPVSQASFWLWGPDDPVYAVAQVGTSPVTRSTESAARRAMFGPAQEQSGRLFIHGIPVYCGEEPRGALVVRARPADAAQALRLAREVARSLAAVLERDLLIEHTVAGGRSIVQAGERQLRRVGLDLHDGPLQEFARFYGDLQLLRHRVVAGQVDPEILPIARDLDALLSLASDLQASLRETSRSLGIPPYIQGSLDGALEHEVRALETVGIDAHLGFEGDPQTLTQSQRIALVRILQEALANIRLHSRASSVNVDIAISDGAVRLEVVDDGRGFEVERVLRRAPRRGRLGLIGMRERARLLDGSFSVRSAPGGPTSLTVVLPAWRPLGMIEHAADEDAYP